MRSSWASGVFGAALATAGAAAAEPPALTWEATTRSPQTPKAISPEVAALAARCGSADTALAAVAQRNVERQLQGGEIMPPDELAFTLRAAGAPHAWPRGWSISGQGLGPAEIGARLDGWLSGWAPLGVRR